MMARTKADYVKNKYSTYQGSWIRHETQTDRTALLNDKSLKVFLRIRQETERKNTVYTLRR